MLQLSSIHNIKTTGIIEAVLIDTPNFNFPSTLNATKCFHIDAYNPLNTNKYYNKDKVLSTLKEIVTNNNASVRNVSNTASSITLSYDGFNGKPTILFPPYVTNSDLRRIVGNHSVNSNTTMTLFAVASSMSNMSGQFVARLIAFGSADGQVNENGLSGCSYRRQGATTGLGMARDTTATSNNNPPTQNFNTIWFGKIESNEMTSSFLNENSTTDVITPIAGLPPGLGVNMNLTFFSIGSSTDSTNINSYFSGNVSEIIMFRTALTTTQRQLMEGYLAHKWGLQSLLPTSHPYKTSYP